ncbi:MAG: Sugar fermentation stimulation protein A [bacterium ADurb.Bin363]|nr:MAG: Sugar fermentation stimulation protein A [bacterium ADurb.Bin363]
MAIQIFNETERAYFIARPNRFLVNCEMKGKRIKAFLPNPGRLEELFFPGSELRLTYDKAVSGRKTEYTVVGVKKEDLFVMLHTHKSNEIVRHLLNKKLIPSLEDAIIISTEVPYKNSRFDFLLEKDHKDFYLEVKSCTLFGEKVAMFPDAVTERGRRHLKELASLGRKGINTGVLFLVHYEHADYFIPDYHTDFLFARTFMDCRRDVNFIPLSIKWEEDLSLSEEIRLLEIPWEMLEYECRDRGSYLLLMELQEKRSIKVGKAGIIDFEGGYYIYTGSAMANLTQRINRHYRKRKKYHWHIDYFREEARIVADFPFRSSEDLECKLAQALFKIADFYVPAFGSSDCSCKSHLFGFKDNPLFKKEFIRIIQYFRMDRLVKSEK